MANKNRRRIAMFDLEAVTSSRKSDNPNRIGVQKTLDLLQKIPKDDWILTLWDSQVTFYCSDFKIEHLNNVIIYEFLLNISNRTLSDPIFTGQNRPGRTRRIIIKNLNDLEGKDVSIHVIIKLPENPLDTALMLVEAANGLTISNIVKFFNKVIKKNVKDKFPDEFKQTDPSGACDTKGNPLLINVDYKFEYRVHANQDFIDMINHGRVKNIFLIDEREYQTPLDQNGYFTEKRKVLEVSASGLDGIKSKWDKIKNLFSSKKSQYGSAKIVLGADENRPEKNIDFDISGSLTHIIGQNFYINSDVELLSSYEKFCDPILSEMKKLILP